MSKMSELDLCVGELRTAAQSLNSVADSLTSLFSGTQPETSVQLTSKPLTLEEVRAVLAEKSRNGHTAKIRELLEKHGAAKLTEIDPQKYVALLAEAEALGNG